MQEILQAQWIGSQTMVGVGGQIFPYSHGNCFSLYTTEGKSYRIVNFVVENLEHLLENGLTFPIDIMPLDEEVAVIHDKRIAHRWYKPDFCEICCPKELLPLPQKLKRDREILQGIRAIIPSKEKDGMAIEHISLGYTPPYMIDPQENF